MNPVPLALAVGLLILAPELLLLITRRSRPHTSAGADRSSLLRLWATIIVSIALASPFGYFRAPEILGFELGLGGLAVASCLLAGGLALRCWAVRTLGQFFTVDVAVHREHRLVTAGPYAWLRHPSYTGLLMELLALALTFQNAASVAIIMVPTTVALLWRIAVEERALAAGLGEEYQLYLLGSYCLVPFLSLRRRVPQPLPELAPDVIPIEAHRNSGVVRRRAVSSDLHVSSRPDLSLPPLPAVPQRDSHVA